jgi:GNAT superfamily N-acetyltransferase
MTNPYLRLVMGEDEESTAPAGVRNPYEEMLDASTKAEDQQRALALNNAFKVNPDEEAELRQLHERGKQSVMPSAPADSAIGRLQSAFPVPPSPNLIQDKAQFKTDLTMRELMNNISSAPALKRKYTQEDFARIASDDSDKLSLVENTLKQTGDFGRSLASAFPSTIGLSTAGLGEWLDSAAIAWRKNVLGNIPGVAGALDKLDAQEAEFWAANPSLARAVTPYAGPGAVLKTYGGVGKEVATAWRPDDIGIEDQIAEGLGQIITAVALTAATGNPVPASVAFAGMGAEQQAESLRAAGLEPSERFGELSVGAAITGGSELLRLGSIMKVLPPGVRSRVLGSVVARISGQALEEGAQEIAEGLAQNLVTTTYDPTASVFEGLAEQGGIAAATAAIFQTGVELLLPGRQRAPTAEQLAAQAALQGRSAEGQLTRLQETLDAAAQSKLVNRDRAALEEFVNEAAEGTELSNVFIAPDSFAQVAEELGVDVMELARQLGVADQMQDSALTSTPITMPVGKFIATVADTDLAGPLMEVAKLNPFLPSRAEIKAAQEAGEDQFVARAEALAAAVSQDETVRVEAQAISTRIAGELNTVGRFTGDANRVYATAATQMYVQLAQRLGISPQQAFDNYPLRVAGQRIGGQAAPSRPEGQVPRTVSLFRGVGEGRDPASATDVGRFLSPDRAVAEGYAGPRGTVAEEQVTFSNLLETQTWMQAKERLGLTPSATMQDLVAAAQAQGYDGVSFTTKNGVEYIQVPVAPEGEFLGQFAGINAATANISELERAKRMKEQGASQDEIWQATGWNERVDGNWRFEVSDDQAALTGERSGRLENVLQHPELYDAYPGLRNVIVEDTSSVDAASLGVAADGTLIVRVNWPRVERQDGSGLLSILHELQHGIQTIETWSGGFSPDAVTTDALKAVNKVRKDLDSGAIWWTPVDVYRRVAGEVEARTTETRAGMTAEERRRTPPEDDIPRGEQIKDPNFLLAVSEQKNRVMALLTGKPAAVRFSADQLFDRDGETLGQTRRLRSREETLKKYGLDPKKKHTTRQVAAALEARTRAKHGNIARGDYSAEAARKIRDWVVDEVMFEVDQSKDNPEKSAVGWYSGKFQIALDRMGLAFNELVDGIEGSNLPGVQQLQSKEGARQFLTALIAVTSDGAKVKDNLRFALATYAYFRENGRLPANVGFGGERNSSMNLNLANIQALLDQYGAEGMGTYLLQKDTVSNLKKVAKTNDETFNTAYKADMQLPLAALYFGPKLGAFYANLRGDTGYLTMDRWWSRTFNRYRGTLLAKPTREGLDRFKALVTEDRKLNQPASEMTDDEALALTAEYVKTYKDKKYKNGTEIEKAANTLWKAAFEKLEDQPFNASDREFMVNTTIAAQKLLKRRGINLTVADIQAVLWYYEKRLYGTLGARQTADISYGDVAVEYAEGFKSGEISYQDVLGERSDDAVSGEPREESYLNQADDENISADQIVDASEDQTIGPEETFGQDEIDGRPQQPGAGDGRRAYSRRGLSPLEGAPAKTAGPDPSLVAVAEDYAAANGIALRRPARFAELDVDRAQRIAAAFDAMQHAPQDPAVRDAYEDLKRQTQAQYDALVAAGYSFTFYDGDTDPYAGNPMNAMRDLRNNKNMAVYGTYSGYGTAGVTDGDRADNPMLEDTGLQWPDQNGVLQPVTSNDLFRAVHDAFGHGLEGAGFRARGEENAWQAHQRLYTGPALAAATTELRGQNSWLNYGPYGETNRTAKVEDTVFAENKIGLLPEWAWTEGVVEDMPDADETFGQTEITQHADGTQIRVAEDVGQITVSSEYGEVKAYTKGDAVVVTGSFVEEGRRGQGIGTDLYQALANLAFERGQVLISDRSVTDQAAGAWRALAQRGYTVLENYVPGEQPDQVGGGGASPMGLNPFVALPPGKEDMSYAEAVGQLLSPAMRAAQAEMAADVNEGAKRLGPPTPRYAARGRRGEYAPRLKEIRLNASADFSTFLHELGHHFLEVYDATALTLRDKEAAGETLTDGERGVLDDTRRLLTELARQTNTEVEGDVLDWWRGRAFEDRVQMHEQFARLTEAYFLDGKAPTPEMQGMFQTFKRWMLQVYSSLTELNVELNDEVRGILDRMVAAEADIKTAEENRGLNAMFATKPAFMTDDEWRGYQQLALAATQAAEDELTARSLRDMKWLSRAKAREIRKLQKEAAEQRAIVEAAVTVEVMSQPINRARTFLRKGINPDGTEVQGPHKLSIELLKAAYPDGEWKKLGYGRYGMLGKEGIDAEMAAELFGFESGDALIRALLDAEPAEATIEGETDRRMLEEFGDLVNEEAINRAADEALHNALRGRVLSAEYAALAKASGQRKMMAAAAQQIAKQVIGKQNAAKLKPQVYIAAERSAARKAEQALRRNDLVGAATAKRDQLLNFELAREAQRVLKQRNRTLDLFRQVTSAKRDTVSKTRNYDLVQVARAILAAHGMGQVRNAPIEYLDLLKRYDPRLYTSLEATLLVAVAKQKTIADLSVDEFLGLGDLIGQLWTLSREEKQIEIEGRRVELEQITTELTDRLSTLGDTERGQIAEAATDAQKNLRSFVGLLASLRRVESWARSMDGGVVGPFTKYVFRPISEAADRYRADRNRLITKFRELFVAIEPTMGGKKIAAPELAYTFKNKAELLHAILHTGNTSNKRKLLLGRQWGAERPDGTLDDSSWQKFIARMAQDGTLTKADFDFAQGVWDLLEETKPLAQATHRKVFGRYFAEITAEPVVTPFGTYAGGYVPAIYDQFFVGDAAVRAQQEQVEANDSTMFPSPTSGFTKGRVEYNEVLELNLQLLPMHIDRVLKFAHLASPVRDVLRILRDKEFARGLEQVDPTAQSDMLLPWLQRASRQIVEEPSKGQAGRVADQFFRGVRNRSGMGLMFANLVNVAQQFTGFPLVLLRVKPQYVGAALARYVTNPARMTKAARGASLMMVERGDNQMSAMYNAIEQIIDKKNLYGRTVDWFGRHTYFLQQAVQNVMDVIVWTGGYDQALASGATEAEAARQGDAVVRETQGSVFSEDISRIETGPAWARTFTHMYSYFSMWGNLLGGEVETTMREVGLRKGAGRLMFVYMIGFLAPAITAQLVADALRGQLPEDEEDDGYLDNWLSWFFMTQAKTAIAFAPIVGQAGNAAIGAFTDAPYDDRVGGSPAISAIEGAVRTPASVYEAVLTDGDKSRAVKDTLNLMTLLTGVPFQAAARPIGYAVDVAEGDIEPTSDLDYLRGLATGTASEASR